MKWDPTGYAHHAAFVAELGAPLLELLAPQPGETILDVGCGDGALTVEVAAVGCDVLGIDASPEQVAATRARGLDARALDAQLLEHQPELSRRFHGILSNAALHWMPDQAAVARGMAYVLRPGGRCAVELGGAGNVARVRAGLFAALEQHGIDPEPRNPWTFPDRDTMAGHLEGAGFAIDMLELFPRPTQLPGDISGWFETFAGVFLDGLPDVRRQAVIASARERLSAELCSAGTWTLDYVRLRFRCHLP